MVNQFINPAAKKIVLKLGTGLQIIAVHLHIEIVIRPTSLDLSVLEASCHLSITYGGGFTLSL